ncbi:hypothetical protein EGW08_020344 [Elysia chlorotica]|uniref:EGF-like domain-containing protein n=1 Tax=Elysia chlorotica TaxID=188477 RepID=A0A433SRK2_ELYCH|nr:hypothetical protein EGW08_020344 [Elysia chlorotica]
MYTYKVRLTIWSLLVMALFLGASLAGPQHRDEYECKSGCLNGGRYFTWGELPISRRVCNCPTNYIGPCCDILTGGPLISPSYYDYDGASGLNPPAAIACLLLAGFLCRLPGLLWGR